MKEDPLLRDEAAEKVDPTNVGLSNYQMMISWWKRIWGDWRLIKNGGHAGQKDLAKDRIGRSACKVFAKGGDEGSVVGEPA